MGKNISFKNHDRFIQLGIAIAALRKMRGMSQEQLAQIATAKNYYVPAAQASEQEIQSVKSIFQ